MREVKGSICRASLWAECISLAMSCRSTVVIITAASRWPNAVFSRGLAEGETVGWNT